MAITKANPLSETSLQVFEAVSAYAPAALSGYHAGELSRARFASGQDVEMLIYNALLSAGHSLDYNPNAHKPGADIFLPDKQGKTEDGFGISVKTGTLNKADRVAISGSRTTNQETHADKIAFFKDTSPDVFFLLSRSKSLSTLDLLHRRLPAVTYSLIAIDGSVISYGKASDWEMRETKRGGLNAHLDRRKYNMKITASMSGQLWIDMDLKYLPHKRFDMTIDLSNL